MNPIARGDLPHWGRHMKWHGYTMLGIWRAQVPGGLPPIAELVRNGRVSRHKIVAYVYISRSAVSSQMRAYLHHRGNQLSMDCLVLYCYQLAMAVSYLESKKFVHRFVVTSDVFYVIDGSYLKSFRPAWFRPTLYDISLEHKRCDKNLLRKILTCAKYFFCYTCPFTVLCSMVFGTF